MKAWLLLVLAACDPNGFSPCHECGPGAIAAGYRYGFDTSVAANHDGTVVRGERDRVFWLDDDLQPARASGVFAPDLTSPKASRLAVDQDGAATAIAYDVDVPTQTAPAVLAHLAADGSVMWTKSVPDLESPALAASRELVVASLGTPTIDALDATDGSVRWSRPAPQIGGLAIDAGGDVVYGGRLEGTVDFGEGFALTSHGAYSGYIVEVGADGVTRWAAILDPVEATGSAWVSDVAVGPGGEIAVTVVAYKSDATLLGTRIATGDQVVVLSADGTRVLWNNGVAGGQLYLASIATDGTHVIIGGGYEANFNLDPSAPYAWELDAYVASISAGGVDWARTGNGYGHEIAAVYSPTVASFEIDQGDYDESDGATGALDYGDVHIDGNGVAIVRLAP